MLGKIAESVVTRVATDLLGRATLAIGLSLPGLIGASFLRTGPAETMEASNVDSNVVGHVEKLGNEIFSACILAAVVSALFALIWWGYCRVRGPASPGEVLKFQKLWWCLAVGHVIVVALLFFAKISHALNSEIGQQVMAGMVGGYVVVGLFVFYVSTLIFSPASVLSAVPGGRYISALRRL